MIFRLFERSRFARTTLPVFAVLGLSAAAAMAAPVLEAPDVALPPLSVADGWQVPNPYRGKAAVLEAGAAAYARHCAACHGAEAVRPMAEAPDLRRLDSVCLRLAQPEWKPRCLTDVDAYYLTSVLKGKLRAGQMHMPAWEGVLAQETVWAIRTFVETRPKPQRRTLPDLPPDGVIPTAAGR